MKKAIYLFMVMLIMAGCGRKEESKEPETTEAQPNVLSEAEIADGWRLLFDGATTNGWRQFGKQEMAPNWKVVDGTLFFDKSLPKDTISQNIITADQFENFELNLEWKIDSCGNSGIMFIVQDDGKEEPYETGPEMQVLDNVCHPDAKIIKHRAGDLYDLISCSTETVKPAREWNQVRILSNQGHVEFWLNNSKVVEFTMFTQEWSDMISKSKFKEWPGFGMSKKGHISLQDHGDNVWYRNIKIKELK